MTMLDKIIAVNKEFRENPPHFVEEQKIGVTKLPSREMAILTCMDTRLVNFLEHAIGVARGDAKILKVAGNSVTSPFDGVVRSLLVCIYELGVKEIFVIGHDECGMAHTTAEGLEEKMLERGVPKEAIHMVRTDLKHWADGFRHPTQNVEETVMMLRSNPLIPKDVLIHGLMIHPSTGELEIVINGYDNTK